MSIQRNQVDSFHEYNGTPVFILPQSENISATNCRMAATFCISENRVGKAMFIGSYWFGKVIDLIPNSMVIPLFYAKFKHVVF